MHFMIYSSISKYNTFNNEFRADRIKDKGRRKPGETRERKKHRGGRFRFSEPEKEVCAKVSEDLVEGGCE